VRVAQNIPFVLGHALYLNAIHGGKASRYERQRRLGR
jgi:hypothetical protein